MNHTTKRLRYVLKRLLQAIPIVFAIVIVNFFLLHMAEGDAVDVLAGEAGSATPEYMAELRAKFGLDQPLVVQYWRWFVLMVQGDMGNSIYGSRIPVSQILIEAAPRTMSLALLAFCVSVAIALPAGLISALRRGQPVDHAVTFIAFLGLSMPDFWMGILLIILFAANLGWLPAIGYEPISAGFWPWFSHLILPATILGTYSLAYIARMTRSFMLDQLSQEYILTARVKGISETRVIWVHAFRNVLVQLITIIGLTYASLLEGSVLTETVFSWPGIGQYITNSLFNNDMNAVLGGTIVVGVCFVGINMLSDLLYKLVDPRVR